MPGGDRTGPMGMGPMSGRAAGYCAGFAVPGFMNAPGGWGFGGRGGGRGRGWRHWFHATGLAGWPGAAWGRAASGASQPPAGLYPGPVASGAMDQAQEVELLKQQAQQLGNALDQIKRRLGELRTQPDAEPQQP